MLATLVHPDDRPHVEASLARSGELRDGEVIAFEYRMRQKDGSYLWFLSRAVVFARDEQGKARVILGVSQDITERKRHEQSEKRIRASLERRVADRNAQLARAEEDLRHRISRELHDEMGQHVSALKVGIESIGTIVSRRKIRTLLNVVREVDRHIDRLVHELRPVELEDVDIVSALASHVEHFSACFRIAVDFHHSGLSAERLPPVYETTLYRVVQEALTNVLKHAEASNVSVVLSSEVLRSAWSSRTTAAVFVPSSRWCGGRAMVDMVWPACGSAWKTQAARSPSNPPPAPAPPSSSS